MVAVGGTGVDMLVGVAVGAGSDGDAIVDVAVLVGVLVNVEVTRRGVSVLV